MDAAQKAKPRNFWIVFLLALFSFAGMGYMLLNFPPGTDMSVGTVHISYLIIFFILLFTTSYGTVAFLLKSTAQGAVVAGLIVSFLLLRLFHITHPFFTILLLVFFASFEGILWKRK